jgi:cytochrome c-type biogenesis protein CcmH
VNAARRLVISLLIASAAAAQTPPAPSDSAVQARVREVSSKLRCPVCQGLSLQDSPSELSQEMKSVVREQIAAGKSNDEVLQYFVGKYGEWILLQPKATGFNLAVYALPMLMLGGGALVVILAVRRWTRSPAEPLAASEEQETL